MSYIKVTSNQEVSMIKKAKSDPPQCSTEILAIQDALDVLGGKWRLLILHYLLTRQHETITFKKMEKDIDGISAKVLSNELKVLEINKLIERKVQNTKPVTVQYSATLYAEKTLDLIKCLVNWGTEHRLHLLDIHSI